jgi:hypothetical protein
MNILAQIANQRGTATAPHCTGKLLERLSVEPSMKANSKASTAPVEHERERAGEHILFTARIRSKIAKQRGDALGDLAHRDVERVGRYPVRAEIGVGGELVPQESELRDTVTNRDYVAERIDGRSGNTL